MAVNNTTIDLITKYESFIGKWYPDPAHGWSVPTCCYGHTDAAGEPYYRHGPNRTFTEQQGREILIRDLRVYEAAVDRHVKVPLNENQRGALVSFTFNLGEGNLQKSTLLRKLNAGDYTGAANEFKRWNRAGGKVLKGLQLRRAAEKELFLTPVKNNVVVEPVPERPTTLWGWILHLFNRRK